MKVARQTLVPYHFYGGTKMPRLNAEELRNYTPGPNDPYDKAFYERIAFTMDLENLQYQAMGIQTTIYYNTETAIREYDPPLPEPTEEQSRQMVNQLGAGRAQVEEQVWSKDTDQARAQGFRDSFDRQVEEYKKKFGPK